MEREPEGKSPKPGAVFAFQRFAPGGPISHILLCSRGANHCYYEGKKAGSMLQCQLEPGQVFRANLDELPDQTIRNSSDMSKNVRMPTVIKCYLPRLTSARYSEAIDIFYTENTFKLEEGSLPAYTLPADLQKAILPQRFSAIRSLDILVDIHDFLSFWEYHRPRYINFEEGKDPGPGKPWEAIGTMKGLRKLRVRFKYNFTQYWDDGGPPDIPPEIVANTEKDTLEPLMSLDWIPDFEVEVSWPADEESEKTLQGAPFRLTRKLIQGQSK